MQPSHKRTALLLLVVVASAFVDSARAAEPSCGRGVSYVSQPKRPDDLLDFLNNL